MADLTNDTRSQYYSGQGVVLIGGRDINGVPLGLRPLGNVSDLKISVNTTVINHKNSQDGQRAIDARLQTETNASISFTMESFIKENLAKALRGDFTAVGSGTVTAEALFAYPGFVTGLQFINAAGMVLTNTVGSTVLTLWNPSAPGTPWDYKWNPASNSVELNDGSTVVNGANVPPAHLGVAPTAVTVGASTVVTVANTAAVGDTVIFTGLTGADAASINGIIFTITAASGTAITVPLNSTGKTITATGTPLASISSTKYSLAAAYTYTAQTVTNALTTPLADTWLRFEGLNTMDTNSPVVVEVFRFQVDPLKELALISDTVGQMVLEGTVLRDSLRASGSNYFNVKQLV
jgi:hypothetical protein